MFGLLTTLGLWNAWPKYNLSYCIMSNCIVLWHISSMSSETAYEKTLAIGLNN